MAEYITKKQAVNVINTAFGHVYDSDSTTVCLVDLQNEIVMTLDEYTDSADIVEITRCRDCGWAEFYETSEAGDVYECNFWNREHYGEHAKVDENDFCSYGSRR